jgi:hypothetical protein
VKVCYDHCEHMIHKLQLCIAHEYALHALQTAFDTVIDRGDPQTEDA